MPRKQPSEALNEDEIRNARRRLGQISDAEVTDPEDVVECDGSEDLCQEYPED